MLFFVVLNSSRCTNKPIADANSKITEKVTFNSFKVIKDVSLNDTLIAPDLENIYSISVVDTFLLCFDLRSPKILHIFGLKSLKPLNQIIDRGTDRGHCLGIANVLTTNNRGVVWLYDITLGKFVKVDLGKAAGTKTYIPEEEIIIDKSIKGIKSPNWINDSLFVANSYSLSDCRYVYLNSKKILRKVGKLPEPKKDWPTENPKQVLSINAMSYASKLVKHPDNANTFVNAYETSDLLEFWNNDRLYKVLRGPNFFDSAYDFRNIGDNMYSPAPNKETKYAFVQNLATSKYIYFLYSGNDLTYGTRLLLYNWQGIPQKVFNLGGKYYSFAIQEISPRSIKIFGLDASTGSITYSIITN